MIQTDAASPRTGPLAWLKHNFVLIVSAVCVLLFLVMQYRLLHYLIWNDEAETVVAAQMMVAGSHLYTEIFNHHGPLTFLQGYLVALIGDGGIVENRIVIALLQWALISTILRSPEIGRHARMFLFLCFAVALTGPLREVFAHMYKYQVLAGMCSAATISLIVLPRMSGRIPGVWAARVSGFCLGSMAFLAFTYIPAALLLGAAGFSRRIWKPLAIGVLASAILSLGFLSLTGSFKGYLAYHFYMNLVILPPYIGGVPDLLTIILVFLFGDGDRIGFFATMMALGATWRLVFNVRAPFPRLICLLLALASYTVRGNMFHALPFYYSMLPLGVLFAAPLERLFRTQRIFSWGMVVILLVRLTNLQEHDMRALNNRRIDAPRAFALIVDAYTKPGDRVISYSFNNFDYLAAHRLPASSHFFFLPWQADYNRAPVLGIHTDPCKEVPAYRPKFVQIDRRPIFGKYAWEAYGGCIEDMLARDYVPLSGTIIYARKDIHVDPELVRKASEVRF